MAKIPQVIKEIKIYVGKDVKEAQMMERDYSKNYLTFYALEDCVFTLTIPANINSGSLTYISYSINNGKSWTKTLTTTEDQIITTPMIYKGKTILWKGEGYNLAIVQYHDDSVFGIDASTFNSSGKFSAYGNVMSLLYGDNFKNKIEFPPASLNNFCKLFYNSTTLINAKNLILPALKLTEDCYAGMFEGCSSLINSPKLPATQLYQYCYQRMFVGCTSLITAPSLPATSLKNECYYSMFSRCTSLITVPTILPATALSRNCYARMFSGCTSLVNAPKLPATTLALACYYQMFYKCTSLTNAPQLPATTLAYRCYDSMFYKCTSLVNAPQLPATTLAEYCYLEMFKNCTSLTNAPELSAIRLANSCYDSMFSRCTSLVNAPQLPAKILADFCYNGMFYGCTSLTTAPILPAQILVKDCYRQMFANCINLNYIKALFTTTLYDFNDNNYKYTYNWVKNVSSTGTFIKNSNSNIGWDGLHSESEIPVGWEVEEEEQEQQVNSGIVRIDLGDYGKWNTYGVAGVGEYRFFNRTKGIPSNFPYNVNTYTGYGGVLLIMGVNENNEPTPFAFEASCPNEHDPNIILHIDDDTLDAVCDECGTHYDIINGTGNALNENEKLIQYKVRATVNGGYIITNY